MCPVGAGRVTRRGEVRQNVGGMRPFGCHAAAVSVPGGPRRFDYRLSPSEQWLLLAWVLLVDALLVGITWWAGWHWFLLYGRATLVLPTLLTAFAWYVRCSHRGTE